MGFKISGIEMVKLRAEGSDCQDFFQRLSTLNFLKLSPGEGGYGLFLTGTAKLISPFIVFCNSKNNYSFIVQPELQENLIKYLNSMIFSEDIVFTESKVKLFAIPNEEKKVEAGKFFPFRDGSSWPWPEGGGEFSFSPFSNIKSEEHLESARMKALIPFWGAEWKAGDNALDVGFLPWIQRQKGCYPGQEVVEKSLNLGHPAKCLILINYTKDAQVGSDLILEGKKVGQITSLIPNLALAIVRWDAKGNTYKIESGEGQCLK